MHKKKVTFLLFLTAIVLLWELTFLLGLEHKQGSLAYLLLNGGVLGVTLYVFKADRTSTFIRYVMLYEEGLARLGVVAVVIALIGLVTLLGR